MELKTRDFGTVHAEETDLISFVEPIFGFEDKTAYLLLCDEQIGPQIAWLQSVEDPALCFILVDPDIADPAYKSGLPANACEQLGEGACECWAVAVIPESFAQATTNLKSPIFINRNNRRAAQVILDGDYPIRFRLADGKEGSGLC